MQFLGLKRISKINPYFELGPRREPSANESRLAEFLKHNTYPLVFLFFLVLKGEGSGRK